MRFDRLSLLETFVRIAERKSLSAAARDMSVSQPSVSRQLVALERRIGVTLVRRTTHDITLTPDGIALLADARRMLSEWETIEDRHASSKDLKGAVRVIAPVALGQSLLAQAASAFLRDHPGISIDWKLDDGAIRFAEEGCDCWVKVGPVPDDTLIVRELARVERLVVGTPDCLRGHHIATPKDLSSLPWLTLGPFEGNRIELFDKAGQPHSFAVQPKFASDNIFAVRETLLQGLGIAIMPRWFIASQLCDGTLVEALPHARAAELAVNLAIASGTKRPARVEQFCEALEGWLSENLSVF